MQRRSWWLYLALALAVLPVYLSADGTARLAIFYGYGFGSVIAILAGSHLHRPEKPVPWLVFAGGLFLFAVGDVAFDLHDLGPATLTVPPVADAIYLSAYPVLAWGLLLLVRHRVRGGDLVGILDGAMVALGVGILAWVFVMQPLATDTSTPALARIVAIAYPSLDLLLLAVVVRLLVTRGEWNPSFGLLAVSVVALLVADGFYGVATVHGTYGDGSLIDLGWIASYILWGAAALHPSMARISIPSTRPESHHVGTLGLLAVAALTSPALLIIEEVREASPPVILLAAGSVGMFTLALARMELLAHALRTFSQRLRGAALRQAALTDAAVALVGAGNADGVAHAAVEAAANLAGGRRSWAVMVAADPTRQEVLASTGSVPLELERLLLEAAAVTSPVALSPIVARHPKNERPWVFAAPIRVEAVEPRAVLFVGDIANGAREFLPTLGLLCSQVGLALQTTEASEERLRSRTERKFQSLVQNSSDIVTLVGPELTILYQSPSVGAVLGRRPEDLVGRRFSEVVHGDDWADVRVRLTMAITGGIGATSSLEYRTSHSDGRWRVVETVMTNLLDDPDVGAIVLNTRDVTDRRALEDELNRQAFHDPLTNLANRALFHDRVAHALDRADRRADPVAVLFLDIDEFKMVNDSLGHRAGDQLLCAVADRIREATRPSDTVARLGGDEFAVLVEASGVPCAAEAVAGRIAEALVRPFQMAEEELTVRASIGIATGRRPESGPDDLMRDADLAMYMAKRNGKGRFEMFHPAMHEEAVRRLQLTAELRRGIEQAQLEVFYQPIVDAASGAAVGAEALVRWNHPDEGLVSPLDFIPIAESTGLIVPLGSWVLHEACRQTEEWRRSGVVDSSFYVSVNLSARQLLDPELIDDVTEALRTSGLPPSALTLEVTESSVMEDVSTTMPRLQALKDLGLRLAIDDFGTGYSSLSYLGNLPVEVVKIDKSFIDRLTGDGDGAAMVRGVIDLSHALGLTSIAEGVELSDQLDILNQLGCDNVQGFLFAKPVTAADMVATLERLREGRELSVR